MSSYKITSWNQIIDQQNTVRPLFTFVPDLEFLNYLHLNPNPIAIRISGSQWYDGVRYASCHSSKDFPNYGPNFFAVTENYVMVLNDVEFSFFPDPKTEARFQIDSSIRSEDLVCIDLQEESTTNIKESFDIPPELGESVEDQSVWHIIIIIILALVACFIVGISIAYLFF